MKKIIAAILALMLTGSREAFSSNFLDAGRQSSAIFDRSSPRHKIIAGLYVCGLAGTAAAAVDGALSIAAIREGRSESMEIIQKLRGLKRSERFNRILLKDIPQGAPSRARIQGLWEQDLARIIKAKELYRVNGRELKLALRALPGASGIYAIKGAAFAGIGCLATDAAMTYYTIKEQQDAGGLMLLFGALAATFPDMVWKGIKSFSKGPGGGYPAFPVMAPIVGFTAAVFYTTLTQPWQRENGRPDGK